MARDEYPKRGSDHPPDTTLCISHRNREKINERVNGILRGRRAHAVFVPKPKDFPASESNQPQDMWLWPDIILMAKVASGDSLKNGLRYKVIGECGEDAFELIQLDKDDRETGKSFKQTNEEVATKLRLTHAVTYFSSQPAPSGHRPREVYPQASHRRTRARAKWPRRRGRVGTERALLRRG